MKNAVFVLILCLVSSQAPITKRESDREHEGFVGPVNQMVATWIPISGSNLQPGSKCRDRTSEYDQTGRITRLSLYTGSCGGDEIREDYTYSPDGNKTTKRQEIRGENSPPPPPPAAILPNAKKENGPGKEARRYDESGRLVEEGMMMPSGQFTYKHTYTYDAKGRLIENTGYESDGRLSNRRVYTYSAEERVPAGFMYYGPDGKIYERTSYTDYEFNSKGDWIRRKVTTEETFNRHSVSMESREIAYYSDNE